MEWRYWLGMTWLALACGCAQDLDTGGGLEPEPEPASQVDDWCEAMRGGAPSDEAFAPSLARAHADARFFGPSDDWLEADAVLVEVLEGEDPFTPSTLGTYAEALPWVCAAFPGGGTLEPASSTLEGTTAILVPGSGALSLPEGAEAVVVDLRGLPGTPEAAAAAAEAVGLALGDDVVLARVMVREFSGFPHQWTSPSVYGSDLVTIEEVVAGRGADLPLVLWTDLRSGSGVSALAGGLRLAGRAVIAGYDVHTAVAEATWTGIEEAGLAWRGEDRYVADGSERWPDLIPADVSTSTPERALDEALALWPPGSVQGEDARESMAPWDAGLGGHPLESTRGAHRAMLLVLHGTLQRFWPYFDVIPDRTEAALVDALAEVDAAEEGDRRAAVHALGRYLHVIEDGHAFFGAFGSTSSVDGVLALQVQLVDGQAVVRASAHDDVLPGDTVVAVDGVPAEEWYAEAMARYSAASEGYLFDLATRELKVVSGGRTLVLRDPDGVERTAEPEPYPDYEDMALVPWGGTYRPSGWLDDLGAPEVYHLNLNGAVTTTDTQVTQAIEGLAGHDTVGLVVDVRDYPSVNHYTVARYLHGEAFSSALFGYPTWTGADAFSWVEDQYDFTPLARAWTGPIVLMVSHKTVSAAENFSQMLFLDPRVTVVGQPSAATNGNITGVYLPGQFYAMFTGMRILNPDGSRFHGIGIAPDVEVVPDPDDFRAGRDPELEAAVEVLLGGR